MSSLVNSDERYGRKLIIFYASLCHLSRSARQRHDQQDNDMISKTQTWSPRQRHAQQDREMIRKTQTWSARERHDQQKRYDQRGRDLIEKYSAHHSYPSFSALTSLTFTYQAWSPPPPANRPMGPRLAHRGNPWLSYTIGIRYTRGIILRIVIYSFRIILLGGLPPWIGWEYMTSCVISSWSLAWRWLLPIGWSSLQSALTFMPCLMVSLIVCEELSGTSILLLTYLLYKYARHFLVI